MTLLAFQIDEVCGIKSHSQKHVFILDQNLNPLNKMVIPAGKPQKNGARVTLFYPVRGKEFTNWDHVEVLQDPYHKAGNRVRQIGHSCLISIH